MYSPVLNTVGELKKQLENVDNDIPIVFRESDSRLIETTGVVVELGKRSTYLINRLEKY